MKKTTDQLLNNLKPFGAYIISFLISILLAVFVSEMVGYIVFYILYIALSALTGFYTDLKKDKFGLIAYTAMVAVSPFVYLMFAELNNVIRTLGILGNAFLQLWPVFYTESFIPAYAVAVIIPLLPIAIGFGIRKAINPRKVKTV